MKARFDSVVIDLNTGQLSSKLNIHLEREKPLKIKNDNLNNYTEKESTDAYKQTPKTVIKELSSDEKNQLDNQNSFKPKLNKLADVNDDSAWQPVIQPVHHSDHKDSVVYTNAPIYVRGSVHTSSVKPQQQDASSNLLSLINSDAKSGYGKKNNVLVLTEREDLKFYINGVEFKDYTTDERGYILNIRPMASQKVAILHNEKIYTFNLIEIINF